MTGWNTDSDGLYQGIKVYCTNGDKLKAPFKCKITDVNTDENKITVRKDDVAEMSDIPDWVHIGQTEDGLPIKASVWDFVLRACLLCRII